MEDMYPNPFPTEPEPDLSTVDALIQELQLQAALLVNVATEGQKDRPFREAEYQDRRRRLMDALQRRGLTYPFPWPDLGQWYGHWTGPGALGTFESRRLAIRDCVAPAIAALERQRDGLSVSDPGGGPLTWGDLDARVAELATEFSGAASRDDLQDVGRRSREIL